jgi:hypothetical protein
MMGRRRVSSLGAASSGHHDVDFAGRHSWSRPAEIVCGEGWEYGAGTTVIDRDPTSGS